MIFEAHTLPLPATLDADLCVVGSGAGGSMAAMAAAEAGLRVVVLEAGAWHTPAQMSQREDDMLPRLYWDGGGRATTDRAVLVHQGKGVGGSTVHNINLCKRIPAALRGRWLGTRRLDALSDATWEVLYAEVEAMLGIEEIPDLLRNRANRLLEEGCRVLGFRGGPLRHNRHGCVGSGFCEIGCAFDAKNNAAKVVLPRAVRAGAEVLTGCHAVHVLHAGGRVSGVRAVAQGPDPGEVAGTVEIHARRVCLAASATATAALLLRSEVPDPSGRTGTTLRLHPGAVVAGDFALPVEAWRGIPQSWECTERLDLEGAEHEDGKEREGTRAWISTAFAHPAGAATLLPGSGPAHAAWMTRYAHLAAFSVMVHDRGEGHVRPAGDRGLAITYRLRDDDRRELLGGLAACARLLFAAGARRVLVPVDPPLVLERVADVDRIADLPVAPAPGGIRLTSVHPMGSVPMDDDPARAAVSSQGRHHRIAGLWVADGSLFPTSIGVPPQLSIYALGLHVGRALVAAG